MRLFEGLPKHPQFRCHWHTISQTIGNLRPYAHIKVIKKVAIFRSRKKIHQFARIRNSVLKNRPVKRAHTYFSRIAFHQSIRSSISRNHFIVILIPRFHNPLHGIEQLPCFIPGASISTLLMKSSICDKDIRRITKSKSAALPLGYFQSRLRDLRIEHHLPHPSITACPSRPLPFRPYEAAARTRH